jgi:hypothetical protein
MLKMFYIYFPQQTEPYIYMGATNLWTSISQHIASFHVHFELNKSRKKRTTAKHPIYMRGFWVVAHTRVREESAQAKTYIVRYPILDKPDMAEHATLLIGHNMGP